ncbi:hypothetical protein F5884DRAFT_750184 [Xylogone sp. PMI_703]|nr:hypothetical protein F5884DRAFT_750184 [Xylogone sp. PMI_703]
MGIKSTLQSILSRSKSSSREKKKSKSQPQQQQQQQQEDSSKSEQLPDSSPAIIGGSSTTTAQQSQPFPPTRQLDPQHPLSQHPTSDSTPAQRQEQEGRPEEIVASQLGGVQRSAEIEAPVPLSFAKSFSSSKGPSQTRIDGDITVTSPPTPRPTPNPVSVGTSAIKTSSRSSGQPAISPLLSEHAVTKMASDEDYAAFLEKANQDPNEGIANTSGSNKLEFKAVSTGVKVPDVLSKATQDAFYISDSDEEFVPVCLKLPKGKKGLPDEVAFADLVTHPDPESAEVSIMDVAEWDPQGQYKELVDATREAAKGSDVRVYRIGKEGARVEYWLVGVSEGHLVGVKALAIES